MADEALEPLPALIAVVRKVETELTRYASNHLDKAIKAPTDAKRLEHTQKALVNRELVDELRAARERVWPT